MAGKRRRSGRRKSRKYKRGRTGYVPYGTRGGTNKAELKWFDNGITNWDIGDRTLQTEGYHESLALIQGGSGQSQRVGDKICLKSIFLKMHLTYAGTPPTTNAPLVAVYLVWDKCPNQVAYTTSAIRNALLAPDGSSYFATNFMNLVTKDRFRVLRHWNLTIDFSGGRTGVYREKFLKLGNKEMIFKDNTATDESSIQSNNLFLYAISQYDAGTNIVRLQWTARIRYTDA